MLPRDRPPLPRPQFPGCREPTLAVPPTEAVLGHELRCSGHFDLLQLADLADGLEDAGCAKCEILDHQTAVCGLCRCFVLVQQLSQLIPGKGLSPGIPQSPGTDLHKGLNPGLPGLGPRRR